VQKIQTNLLDTVICKGDFFEYNGKQYFDKVTLQDTMLNQYGCDSLRRTIQLGVRLLGYSQWDETRCNEFTWAHNGATYDKSGIYSDTIRNLASCDSIVSLHLKINPSFYFKDNHPAECEEFIWDKTGQKFIDSGIYYMKYKTIGGCDSIYELKLTVNPSYRSEETVEVFERYYWTVNKETYTESGQYTEIYTTANGCDSIITLDLRVKKYGKLWIPNIFSPNGDGSNDRFVIFSNPEIREITRMRIYSRTGNLVFDKENFAPNEPENGWDGTFLSRMLDPAVFAFLVEYEDIYGFKQTEAGSVTLLR
jgi:gliding motility-associated-like protein